MTPTAENDNEPPMSPFGKLMFDTFTPGRVVETPDQLEQELQALWAEFQGNPHV